jgi:two-component system LytT family response regulator
MTMNVLIVDDEPLAREALTNAVNASRKATALHEAKDAFEALQLLEDESIDVMFLDIDMPEMDAFTMLGKLEDAGKDPPVIIFVTAYNDSALRAFDHHAVDYILKPFDQQRVNTALEQAEIRIKGQSAAANLRDLPATVKSRQASNNNERIAIKTKGRILFIEPDKIDFAEAQNNYVLLHTQTGAHMVRGALSDIEQKLLPLGFIRIHRSVVVNVKSVKEVQPWFTGEYILRTLSGREFTVTRKYKSNLSRLATLAVGADAFTEET